MGEMRDVSAREYVAGFWNTIKEQNVLSPMVLVLNAASVSPSVPLLDIGVEELTAAFAANVLSPYHCAQTLHRQLAKVPEVLS